MIRLSISDLESWRHWKNDEDALPADLFARLAHDQPPTPQMLAGRAFAKLMESAGLQDIVSATVEGWTFRFELDAEIHVPPIREIKAEVLFETPSGPVTLVGKCDGLHGLTIHDQKLSEKFDAERYLDSLQWKSYLHLFGAREFIYDVFVGKYGPDQTVTVTEYHELPFFAYPAMKADVERAVSELAQVIVEYMPERVTR